MLHRLATAALVLALALGDLSLAAAARAAAGADDGARQEGRCGPGVRWRIEAESDDGRVGVEVRFDTRRANKRWSWVLLHNGTLSDRGTARTDGSGTFEIARTAVDVDGADGFRVRAVRKAVVCVARVTL